jgi:DNA replication protein DnaC
MMLNETTINKLNEMRLGSMAESLRAQTRNPAIAALSFEERIGLIVDMEWARRKNKHLEKLIKNASFKFPNACIEDIEYHSDRHLDQAQLLRLSTCNYIREKHNVIIMGASGAGKTYIGNALGISACRNFFPTKYIRLPELLTDLAIARGDGTYKKVVAQYKKVQLLIFDEWLLVPLTMTEARDLLEIIEVRHQTASTIFISQFAPAGWHSKIGESTIADAILDRIVHDSYEIRIEGEDSMRKRKGIPK